MRYEAEVRVFDVMDVVHLKLRIWSTDGLDPGPPRLVLEETHTLHGRGIDDPCAWLADPLCLVTETLWARESASQ